MPSIPLNDNIIYLTSSFAHHFSRLLTISFQSHKIPITAKQFAILGLLAGEDGLPQNEIGKKLERDKTTITRNLVILKKQALIRHQEDKSDTRSKNIHITSRGRKLQARALQIAGSLYSQVMLGINDKEIKQAVSLLQKMNLAIKQYNINL